MIRMVGAEGFEPPTLCSQSRCATRLRYAPTSVDCIAREGSSAGSERCNISSPRGIPAAGPRSM